MQLRALSFVLALIPGIALADVAPETTSTAGSSTGSPTSGAVTTGIVGGTADVTTGMNGTTGASTGTTGPATTGDGTTGSNVPPPEYTGCGCRADATLAGSALLVGLVALGRRRRR